MNKKMGLLVATFLAFAMTSLSALAIGIGDAPTLMGCTYQYTQCSNDACSNGDGAKGEHVYHCTTDDYVRTVDTCCGG